MSDATRRAFAPARPGAVIESGGRDRNAPALRALLDCLARGLPIHASQAGIRAAGPEPAPVLCCQSSGSGGRVKTIRRSHGSWIASFEVNRATFGLSARDCYGVLGELGHSLSLYATLEALQLGARVAVLAGDGPRSQIARLAAARVSVLYATPTQLRRLLLAAGEARLPAVTHVFSGGGKLDAACRAGVAALCPGAVVREFYGASETSFITIADAATPVGSVGRAYPEVSIRLGAGGRVFVASPYLFDGYAEADLPSPPREDGHLGTGDIGMLDAAGHLFLRGRESRMVTVADRTLFLEDIEAALTAAGAGVCAAVAVPDALRGQAVVAIVEGGEDAARAALLGRACRDALGEHAGPRRVLFLPRLPALASGKPDLAALARMVGPAP
ncbi:AMP-binding protein [Amaricoccus solimangrovi]|uniref:Long-chain fatty acid--CoA ligase n=1 Tax=Amaricoccus solimangrovi TaxID=2589815 RepID=A0A501WW50_9RHOB|nr:AMP-binding protein [Amaricoccus solimangrovi]TPE51627.1 long-chain fatty acid--CoA ligase [Amaricoccus solimangrovi]